MTRKATRTKVKPLSTVGLSPKQAERIAGEIVDNALARSQETRCKVLAANARVKAALEHIHEAREVIDAACRDLCSVQGAAPVYRDLVKLSDGARDAIRDINYAYAQVIEPFKLDGSPTDEDIDHPHKRGCGKEPITEEERDLVFRVIGVADPASDCAVGNDEIAKVRELLERVLS